MLAVSSVYSVTSSNSAIPKGTLAAVAIRRLPGGCVLLTNGSQLFSFFAHKNLLGFVVWEESSTSCYSDIINTPIKACQSHVVKHKNTATNNDFKAIPAERQRQICACQGSPGLPISHTEGCRKIGKKTTFGSVLNKEIPLIYPINPKNPKILSFSWKHDKKPSNLGVSYFQTDPCDLSCTTQLCAQKRGRKASKAQNESRPNEQQLHVSPKKNVKPQKNSTTTCHKCHGQMHSFKRPALKRFQDPAWPRSARLEHSINWLKEVWLICAI